MMLMEVIGRCMRIVVPRIAKLKHEDSVKSLKGRFTYVPTARLRIVSLSRYHPKGR